MQMHHGRLPFLMQERGVSAAAGSGKLTASDDVLILEDEKARMVLRCTEDLIGRVVTGKSPQPHAAARRQCHRCNHD